MHVEEDSGFDIDDVAIGLENVKCLNHGYKGILTAILSNNRCLHRAKKPLQRANDTATALKKNYSQAARQDPARMLWIDSAAAMNAKSKSHAPLVIIYQSPSLNHDCTMLLAYQQNQLDGHPLKNHGGV
ncbi:hypothetical protein CHS0354_007311 [Potamilus streckersoni]|uniref:Uncharacterized protein n=1 Tax=Potamilus streckersoni TaxID=2493646 RepID=A0AAE0WBN1_9BIVA|nr:hypothetical protein CHS0354_007311 [Potamilus streckersoni]